MATLSKFKTDITNKKLLQQTYYKVSFTGLNNIKTGVAALGTDFDIYVQSSRLPGKRLTNVELKKHAVTLRMPNTVEYEGTWNCEILIDLSLQNYELLLKWQREYCDLSKDAGGERGFPPVQAKIEVLDNYYKPTGKSLTIYGVFPSNVPDLEFNQETNEFVKPSVEFTYSYADDMQGADPLVG